MGGSLPVGKNLLSTGGKTYEIIQLIGVGGQGEVYEVKTGKRHFALKWYLPYIATTRQYTILENLILSGPPDKSFLWPKDIIKENDSFGYIMELRPNSYNNLIDLLKRRVKPSLRILSLSGFNIAKSFRSLHARGWCYRDISWGNLFIDYSNGKVLICDNDNAVPDGTKISGIDGTLGFMAPEIVLGSAVPSTDTDLFSLAILLFYLFNIHHPLEGALESNIKCLDALARNKLYGENPVFIWDPKNTINRPVTGYQQNAIECWKLYPEYFKDLFIQSFTEGIRNPQRRITEREWQVACIRLSDSIMNCSDHKCDTENFHDRDGQLCWRCNKVLPIPVQLILGDAKIVLNKHTQLTQHHAKEDFCIEKIIGQVLQKPDDPNQWGIMNISTEIWTFIKPDGQATPVGTGRTVPLIKGSKINFGKRSAEIH